MPMEESSCQSRGANQTNCNDDDSEFHKAGKKRGENTLAKMKLKETKENVRAIVTKPKRTQLA